MARTPKIIRKWVKDEKRLIKLLYRKGFLKGRKGVENIYWASYRKLKGKRHKCENYRFSVYLPELHWCEFDYWGEADEYAVVSAVLQDFFWKGVPEEWDGCNGNWPKSSTKIRTREDLLKHLQTLPTIVGDSKINRVLIKDYQD